MTFSDQASSSTITPNPAAAPGPAPPANATLVVEPSIPAPAPSPGSAPPPPASPIVVASSLVKRYGDFAALDDVSFDVPEGAIFGLIGPNGAGKSTTFSIIASLLQPTSGSVKIGGFDPAEDARAVRTIIGYMPDQLGVYGGLSASDYLRFFAGSYKLPRDTWTPLIDGLLELVGLGGKRDVDVDTMSRGMKQRMSLARALVHDPEVLILDEPASGLDPRARVELRDLLRHLSVMGKTIIISSHILSELQELCTDVAIIEGGKVLASGSPQAIASALGGRRAIVTFSDGTTEEFTVANDHEQAALLRQLVLSDDREVLTMTTTGEGLEELFLQLTEGGVR